MIRIRAAADADALQIAIVVNAAFAVAEDFVTAPRTSDLEVSELLHGSTILVAEDHSGRIVGAVRVAVEGSWGELRMLAVHPACQGLGIASALIAAAEELCMGRGCLRMVITILSLRSELDSFYGRFGYKRTGTQTVRSSIPFKPGVRCHEIVLSKDLDADATPSTFQNALG